jgi:Phage terminase large subunit (GpA)
MDSYDGAEAVERAWRDGLKPDPLLTVSEWADRYRVLSQRASSEPGRWRTERTPYLREVLDALSPSSPFQRVVLMKGAQVGVPLALDTPLPTPAGWTTMGAVCVGDHLFDENGRPCRVTGVSEVMTGHPCYRLAFDDREQVVADGSHRWPVWDFTDDSPVRKVLRTDEMLGRLKIGKSKRYRFAVDCCRPVELPDQDLIIHPYVLGAWLGDGSSVMNHLSVHEDDEEIAEHLRDCGVEVEFRLPRWRKGKCANVVIDPTFRTLNDHGVSTAVQHRSRFTTRLRMLDLLENKHVPISYLRASQTQRLELAVPCPLPLVASGRPRGSLWRCARRVAPVGAGPARPRDQLRAPHGRGGPGRNCGGAQAILSSRPLSCHSANDASRPART